MIFEEAARISNPCVNESLFQNSFDIQASRIVATSQAVYPCKGFMKDMFSFHPVKATDRHSIQFKHSPFVMKNVSGRHFPGLIIMMAFAVYDGFLPLKVCHKFCGSLH